MKINEFQKEQKAYVLACDHRRRTIKECSVVSVGRKYVTVSIGHKEEKFVENDCYQNALSEVTEYGYVDLLFASKEEVEKYEEIRELRRWLSADAASFKRINSYSLEQLRAVKEILEGGEEND